MTLLTDCHLLYTHAHTFVIVIFTLTFVSRIHCYIVFMPTLISFKTSFIVISFYFVLGLLPIVILEYTIVVVPFVVSCCH